jgi:hypothetical protein
VLTDETALSEVEVAQLLAKRPLGSPEAVPGTVLAALLAL